MIYITVWMYLLGMYLTYEAPLDEDEPYPELSLADYLALLFWPISLPIIFIYAFLFYE